MFPALAAVCSRGTGTFLLRHAITASAPKSAPQKGTIPQPASALRFRGGCRHVEKPSKAEFFPVVVGGFQWLVFPTTHEPPPPFIHSSRSITTSATLGSPENLILPPSHRKVDHETSSQEKT
jgi:hypothetical protein